MMAKKAFARVWLCAGIAVLCQSAADAQECREFGTPSYQATREIEMMGKTVTSKVYIAGDREREEVEQSGRTMIRIRDPQGTVAFDETSKSGVRMPAPSVPKQVSEKDPNVRVQKDRKGDVHTTTIQRKQGEAWVDFITVVCRTDGVLLERSFPAIIDGKPGRSVTRHTDIKIEPVGPELFQVPSHVNIKSR